MTPAGRVQDPVALWRAAARGGRSHDNRDGRCRRHEHPVSVALLPIGFVSLLAGVVLPRIEGRFIAGPSGLSAEVLAVHELDRQPRLYASGPAIDLPIEPSGVAKATGAPGSGTSLRMTIGDVWHALDQAGIKLD